MNRSRRSPLRLLPRACLAAAVLAVAPSVLAQGAKEADALLEHGIQLREQGHDDQALAEFRHAYALAATPRARAQMALAEQALGSWLLADQHLREALSHDSDPWIVARRGVLETAAAAIGRHLGTLLVTGTSHGGARVFLDGVDVGAFPLPKPIPVETGTRLLEVRAPGFYPVVRRLEVTAGSPAREQVNLVPQTGAPQPGDAPLPEPASTASGDAPLTDGGKHTPGTFHATFLPGGPAVGAWTLRDASGASLCKLPCAYWIDPARRYDVVRASFIQGESDLHVALPPTPFTDGAEVRAQVRGPTGSTVGGIVLAAGGAAITTLGIVLIATAPSTSDVTSATSGYLDIELGVTAIVAGVLATGAGIAVWAVSNDWRVEAKPTGSAIVSLGLSSRGLELAAGDVHSWLTPGGLRGTF